jgi:hypothetical protein
MDTRLIGLSEIRAARRGRNYLEIVKLLEDAAARNPISGDLIQNKA